MDSLYAQSIIFQLEQKLHNLDVHVFDDEISKAKDDIGVIPKQTPGKNEKEDKKGTKQLSKVELLLSSGKFAEAKKEFASEGNSQMAQICSELIKSKRTIALYKSGFESVKRNNNKTTISNTIRDLERLYYLYKQYAIDASEIELLINNYKSV